MNKPKILWIAIVSIITINLFFYLTKFGGETVLLYVSNLLPIVCSIIAVLSIFSAVRSFKAFDYTKLSWLFILIGIMLYFLGESIYAIVEIKFPQLSENFPGVADYFWCVGYIPLFIGLAMMFIGYKKSGLPIGKPSLYIVIALAIFILATVVTYFLLIPVIQDPETDGIAKAFYLFYPIADFLVVIPASILIYITSLFGSAKITRPWKYLTFGFFFFTISDLLYSYLDWMGMYGSGNLIDLGWHTGYLLIAMSGLYQCLMVKSIN